MAIERERLAPWLGPLHIYTIGSPFPIQVGMNNFPFSPLTYDLPARAFIIHMYMCAPPYAEILNNLLLLWKSRVKEAVDERIYHLTCVALQHPSQFTAAGCRLSK
jgi:hypothetical protein